VQNCAKKVGFIPNTATGKGKINGNRFNFHKVKYALENGQSPT
jgi:hypothetical protein